MNLTRIMLACVAIFLFSDCAYHKKAAHQKKLDTKYFLYYQNKIDPGSVLVKTRVHYSLERTENKKFTQFVYKQYYPEKKIKTHQISFRDYNMTTPHGHFNRWYDDGSPHSIGFYSNGKATDEWTFYQPNKKGYYKINYILGKREGEAISYDSLGIKSEMHTYKYDKRNGPFEIYKNGTELVRKGVYNKGKLVSEEKLDENGNWVKPKEGNEILPLWKSAKCNELEEEEKRTCANAEMMKFINDRIQYPQYCRAEEIEGTVKVRFAVTTDGRIDDIYVIHGICADMEKEYLRVLNLMPGWLPGEQRGKKVKVYFNLPIKFYLK